MFNSHLVVAAALSFAWLLPQEALAHSVTGDLGSVEVLPPGHYHLHAPFTVDMNGHLEFESPLCDSHEEGGEHEEEHGAGPSFTLTLVGDFDGLSRKVVASKLELPVDSWSIEPARAQDSRWLYTNQKWSLGAGPELHHEPIGLGLAPGVESSVFHRTLCETAACDQEGLRRLPEDLSYWRAKPVGERISYTKAKALHLHLPVGPHGLPSFALGTELETSWQISIEKTSENRLTIKAGRDKAAALSGEAEVILASAGLSAARGTDVQFEFTLDLAHAEADANYARFLAGRIDFLQEMADSENGVKFFDHDVGRNRTRSVFAMAGIPVLSGVGVESTRTVVSSGDDEGSSHTAIIQRVLRARGVLSKHLMRAQFVVAHLQRSLSRPEPRYDFSALWLFEKDKTTDERVEKWLAHLGRTAAMPELERIHINGQIDGYLRAEVRAHFSQELILGWLGIDGLIPVRIPQTLAKSDTWARLRRRTARAIEAKDDRKLSAVLASAVRYSLGKLGDLRKEWMTAGPEFPVHFQVTFSGEEIPNTTKNWMIAR